MQYLISNKQTNEIMYQLLAQSWIGRKKKSASKYPVSAIIILDILSKYS